MKDVNVFQKPFQVKFQIGFALILNFAAKSRTKGFIMQSINSFNGLSLEPITAFGREIARAAESTLEPINAIDDKSTFVQSQWQVGLRENRLDHVTYPLIVGYPFV